MVEDFWIVVLNLGSKLLCAYTKEKANDDDAVFTKRLRRKGECGLYISRIILYYLYIYIYTLSSYIFFVKLLSLDVFSHLYMLWLKQPMT